MQKKNFMKNSTLAIVAVILLSLGCTSKQTTEEAKTDTVSKEVNDTEPLSNVGVQIYSVRDALKEDFEGTVKKVADIGYKYVEAYGMDLEGNIFGMSPTEYKKVVEDNGMELISCHTTYFTPEQAPAIIKASKEAGLKYLIVPYLSEELQSDYLAVAKNFNEVGKLFKGTGIKFGYHNHAFEFEKQGDAIPMEILIENTDPELVTFEADLYWVVKGGYDPMELINKYPGRFSLYHVKDANQDLEQTTLGTGIVDFKALLGAKEKAGLEYYFVEDERTDDPFANLQADYDYISNLEVN